MEGKKLKGRRISRDGSSNSNSSSRHELETSEGGSSSTRQELETRRADKSVWLMKCPPEVSRSWLPTNQANSISKSDQPPPPPHIAKVVVSFDPLRPDDDPQCTMEMAAKKDSGSNAPKSYSMEMSRDFIPMSVFSETSQGRVYVEGKVLDKFEMKPNIENIENYGKLCRERTKKSMAKTRQVKVLQNDHGEYMIPKPVTGALVSKYSKESQSRPGGARRIRRDRGEMETRMFKLFEKQPYWSLRELIDETCQPEQFLKEILKELCFYNRGGQFQGTYELKPQYKKQQESNIITQENKPNIPKDEEDEDKQQGGSAINQNQPNIPN